MYKMQGSRRMNASVWDTSLLPCTPVFSKGSDGKWITKFHAFNCYQKKKKKKVYDFIFAGSGFCIFFRRQSHFLLHQSKKKWRADILASKGGCRGWTGVTLWEKGMQTMYDTSSSIVAPFLKPCTCLASLRFCGHPHLLLCPLPNRAGARGCLDSSVGAPQTWLVSLPEVHSSLRNMVLIRQQIYKMFLSSSALKLIYPFHICQNMSDI